MGTAEKQAHLYDIHVHSPHGHDFPDIYMNMHIHVRTITVQETALVCKEAIEICTSVRSCREAYADIRILIFVLMSASLGP